MRLTYSSVSSGLMLVLSGLITAPSDKSRVNGQVSSLRFRSYQQDVFLNEHMLPPTAPGYPFLPGTIFKESELVCAPMIFDFIEATENTTDTGSFGFYIPQPYQWGNQPTDRHSQGANIGFMDGHAEYHRGLSPKRQSTDVL